MEIWRDFLDSLDTPGGHVFILLMLLLTLVLIAQWNASAWILRFSDMTAGAFFGALVGKARANGSAGPPRVPPAQ